MTMNSKTEPEHKSSDLPDHKAQQKKATWKFMWLHLAMSYALIAPVALLTPDSIFTDLPMARDFTDGMARWIPMIDRITAYRHPNTDVLRFVWAYAWAVMPFLFVMCYVSSKSKMYLWDGAIKSQKFYDLLGNMLFSVLLSTVLFLSIWYWPNLTFNANQFLGEMQIRNDARKIFFRSFFSIATYTPLVMFAVTALLTEIVVQLNRAIKLVKSNNSFTSF
jgi:hypothetical protein